MVRAGSGSLNPNGNEEMSMKQWMKRVTAVAGLAMLAVAAHADAQTTAAGPYYATPSWDQTMPASTRFVVLSNFENAAVLDRETGLVWDRAPAQTTLSFTTGVTTCLTKQLGGRLGWRLPTAAEASSLLQSPSAGSPSAVPDLPAGHPFTVSEPLAIMTVTSLSLDPTGTFVVSNIPGGSGFDLIVDKNGTRIPELIWCIRGPDGGAHP
jgi:hypothetical protein